MLAVSLTPCLTCRFLERRHGMKTVIERLEPGSGDYIANVAGPLVVLFAGSPHSAANVSSVMLGQHPRVFATDELRDFPSGRQINDDRHSSCRSDSPACGYWRVEL
jgi:hypothetical protein